MSGRAIYDLRYDVCLLGQDWKARMASMAAIKVSSKHPIMTINFVSYKANMAACDILLAGWCTMTSDDK